MALIGASSTTTYWMYSCVVLLGKGKFGLSALRLLFIQGISKWSSTFFFFFLPHVDLRNMHAYLVPFGCFTVISRSIIYESNVLG